MNELEKKKQEIKPLITSQLPILLTIGDIDLFDTVCTYINFSDLVCSFLYVLFLANLLINLKGSYHSRSTQSFKITSKMF